MDAKSFHPDAVSPNSSVPTNPNMNMGPGAWHAASKYPLSLLDSSPFFNISVTVTAPTGNPPNEPRIYAFKYRFQLLTDGFSTGTFNSHWVKMMYGSK